MYTGAFPPASVHATWLENIEVWAIDTDTLYDLSTVDEITLKLRNPYTGYDDLTLKKTDGDITLPSTGIIQWRAEQGAMSQLDEKLYDVILTIEEDDEIVLLALGNVSILD